MSCKNEFKCCNALGVSLAVVISFVKWGSIPWAILHGILGWLYVIYYAIQYC